MRWRWSPSDRPIGLVPPWTTTWIQATYAGIYGVSPLHLSLPTSDGLGNPVPVAGLGWVGVHPDRRRGVLWAMMTDHLRRTREAGVAISALHASQVPIYGRFGYGMASTEHTVTLAQSIPIAEAAFGADIATELVSPDVVTAAQRCAAVLERWAWTTPGLVVPDAALMRRTFFGTPERVRGTERRRFLFARDEARGCGGGGAASPPEMGPWQHPRGVRCAPVGRYVECSVRPR